MACIYRSPRVEVGDYMESAPTICGTKTWRSIAHSRQLQRMEIVANVSVCNLSRKSPCGNVKTCQNWYQQSNPNKKCTYLCLARRLPAKSQIQAIESNNHAMVEKIISFTLKANQHRGQNLLLHCHSLPGASHTIKTDETRSTWLSKLLNLHLKKNARESSILVWKQTGCLHFAQGMASRKASIGPFQDLHRKCGKLFSRNRVKAAS